MNPWIKEKKKHKTPGFKFASTSQQLKKKKKKIDGRQTDRAKAPMIEDRMKFIKFLISF